jgi:hypothetical protein
MGGVGGWGYVWGDVVSTLALCGLSGRAGDGGGVYMGISGNDVTSVTMTLSDVTAINNTAGGVSRLALSVLCGGLSTWRMWNGHVGCK